MGGINNEGHAIARRRFLVEFNRLPRLTVPMLVHLKTPIPKETWKFIEKYHIYQADALQIASAKL